MDARPIVKAIIPLVLFGGIAAGRASAAPPPWANSRHDRNDSDRDGNWRGQRAALDGTLKGRYRRGDRHVTVRSGRTDYRVNLSGADVAAREIPDGARVLVWGSLSRHSVDATRLAVVVSSEAERDRYEGRPHGGYEGRPNGGGSDRYGHSTTLYGVVSSVDQRGGTFRLRANNFETYTVSVDRDTRILSRGESANWGDVREGGRVRVEGNLRGSSIAARTVEGFGK